MYKMFILVFLVSITSIFSQEKSKELYGVILKDSTKYVGYITNTDSKTRMVTFNDTSGLEIKFYVKDILYQTKIKNESDRKKIQNYDYDRRGSILRIIHSIKSFLNKNNINIEFLSRLGLFSEISNPSLTINYGDDPSQIFEYKNYESKYGKDSGSSLQINKTDIALAILYKNRISISFAYNFTNNPMLSKEYTWLQDSQPNIRYWDCVDISYKAKSFSPTIRYYLPLGIRFINIYAMGSIEFNTIKLAFALIQKYKYVDSTIGNEINTINEKTKIQRNNYGFGAGIKVPIKNYVSIFLEYYYSIPHDYEFKSKTGVGRLIIPQYVPYDNRDYLSKIKFPNPIINFGLSLQLW